MPAPPRPKSPVGPRSSAPVVPPPDSTGDADDDAQEFVDLDLVLEGSPTSQDYIDLVLDDAYGRATADEASSLRSPEHVEKWYSALTQIKTGIEGKLSKINALIAEKKQQCIVAGPSAKDEFFRFEAAQKQERARRVSMMTAIERRIREAKIILQPIQDQTPQRRIVERLFALERENTALREEIATLRAQLAKR
jgi:hypothetical protein